jgi:RNA polymerase sigma-70 factor (sigma-E family)
MPVRLDHECPREQGSEIRSETATTFDRILATPCSASVTVGINEGVTVHDTIEHAAVHPDRGGRQSASNGFEEFVQATGDRIYRSALLLSGNHHLAEDLTQTTYAKVYAAWSRVSAADSPLAYTRTVLLRTFLAQRRLRRVAEYPVAELPERSAQGPDVDSRLELLAAMRRLSTQDRTVLALRYWEDLSIADTAELLGIRASTCRTRTTRALARLRTLLPDLTLPHHDHEDPS